MNQDTNFVWQHIFSQLIILCNKSVITPVINKCGANRYSKKLKAYEHFDTMLYGALCGCTPLRKIVMGVNLAGVKLKHLNMDYVPPKSTLADGNCKRSSKFFEQIYYHLYDRYRPSFWDSTGGDNQNAIEIQIWWALISLLLLSVLHQQHKSTKLSSKINSKKFLYTIL